ncbi:MAG: hypothetical protein ACE37F_02270 [Nannocystaceae bacterium]|nr:hypothetical protein [bacterium]
MRIPACLLALALLTPAIANANEGPQREDGGRRRARAGGLGYMQLGTHIGPVGDIGGALRAPNALGDRATSPEFGYTFGGGGRALLLRRLVIGGRGFGLFTPRVGGQRGFATVTAGGGGFELGVAAVNRKAWLLIPYVGGGAGGMTVEVANESDAPLAVADDEPIPVEGRRSYDAGFGYIEFGVATHRLLFFGDGGLALGLDVGGMISVAATPWNTGGRDLEGIDRPRLRGGFLRLTIGGGGFTFD